ncbi:YajQ family cyclic di-GMP-binding protein [Ectothiorhodospiraceae bacterium BW-2]|nr:YajQ family cyclic di-GMP-binding protein [Ectothiorhodospiraceae bacterium BW-2]
MPSFDIVSEVDAHELTNAVDQTNREVGNRFDFKGSQANIEQGEGALALEAQSEFQLSQMVDILYQKLSKRGIDIRAFELQSVQEGGGRARQTVVVKQGIATELGKKLVKQIKESKLKVQAAIQGEQVRVSGKKRDDLQQVIALLKESKQEQPLQFNNFRD